MGGESFWENWGMKSPKIILNSLLLLSRGSSFQTIGIYTKLTRLCTSDLTHKNFIVLSINFLENVFINKNPTYWHKRFWSDPRVYSPFITSKSIFFYHQYFGYCFFVFMTYSYVASPPFKWIFRRQFLSSNFGYHVHSGKFNFLIFSAI